MIVKAKKLGFGICLRHKDGRGPMSATNVCNTRTRAQFCLDPMKRRNPACRQVGQIIWAEEALRPFKKSLFMLMPSKPLARPKDLGKFFFVLHAGSDEMVEARQVHGHVSPKAIAPAPES